MSDDQEKVVSLPPWSPELGRKLRQLYQAAPPELGEVYLNNEGEPRRRPSKHVGMRAVYEYLRNLDA